MRNVGLDEAQAGIKIAGRNINNLRYTEDITPYGRKQRRITEPLDESGKIGLKFNIQKTKIMASSPITLWPVGGENFNSGWLFFGLQNHCGSWLQSWN